MRIVTTTVDQTTFRKKAANAERLAAATGLIDDLAREAALLVLPAGYLRADVGARDADVALVARPVVARARRRDLAIVLGIDACADAWADKVDVPGLVEREVLPMWIVAWAPGDRHSRVWRQRSTTSGNGPRCDPALATTPRTLAVQGRNVEVVTCGEAFNHPLREAIAVRAPDLAAVVIPAHTAARSRHWQAQRWFSVEAGLPALRSVHAHGVATNAEGLPRRRPPRAHELTPRDGPPRIAPVEYAFA